MQYRHVIIPHAIMILPYFLYKPLGVQLCTVIQVVFIPYSGRRCAMWGVVITVVCDEALAGEGRI